MDMKVLFISKITLQYLCLEKHISQELGVLHGASMTACFMSTCLQCTYHHAMESQ